MFQSKLVGLLKHFSKKEMVQLGYFLESPFFFRGKKEQKLIEFFDFLQRFHPKFSNKKLAKEKVFTVLFPDLNYNEQKLQQLMTKFNKAIESFIEQTYQQKIFGFPPRSLALSIFYREKKLYTNFDKLHQNEASLQARQEVKDPYHYWLDFLLAKDLTEQQSLFNIRKSDLNLPHMLSRLDYFFLASKLEGACVLLNQQVHQVSLAENSALETLEALLPLLERGGFREEPLIDLLYQAYQLLKEKATFEEFYQLKEAYDKKAMTIGLDQRQVVHGVLRIFCSIRLNEGEEDYLELLFNLYQNGLKQGVMTFDNGLLPATFQSIVTLGLKLKKYKWVEAFLEEYRYRLVHTETPESTYMLNQANLLFAIGSYQEALNCLTYEFADIYLKLVARRLEIQICYEIQSDSLDAKIQAFKVFVFRVSQSRLPDLQRDGYNNFVDLLKQIIHPSTRFNPKRQQMLREKINQKKTIAERKWLLEKINELS